MWLFLLQIKWLLTQELACRKSSINLKWLNNIKYFLKKSYIAFCFVIKNISAIFGSKSDSIQTDLFQSCLIQNRIVVFMYSFHSYKKSKNFK